MLQFWCVVENEFAYVREVLSGCFWHACNRLTHYPNTSQVQDPGSGGCLWNGYFMASDK